MTPTARTGEGKPGTRRWAGVAALATLAAGLLVMRPATPFEWDEVLFLRALDTYDVGAHSPHPPGYPAYVGAGKALRAVTGDPLLALQSLSVLSAVAVALVVARLGAREGGSRAGGALGVVAVCGTPAFLFHANVGLSDVPGAAAMALAAWALLRSLDDPRALKAAGFATALAVGVRPQLLGGLLPLGAWALVHAARRRDWRGIGGAVAVGVAGSAACWIPAVLATGPERFFEAFGRMSEWIAREEAGYRLGGVAPARLAEAWLVRPFGTLSLALSFWGMVLVGSWAWWRDGARRLVLVAAGVSGSALLVWCATLNFTTSVRYAIPALPFLALLAAGVGRLPGRPALRRVGVWLVIVWAAAAAAWMWHPFARRVEAAPGWAALAFVRERVDPAVTTVAVSVGLTPHAEYLLLPAGFKLVFVEFPLRCAREIRPAGGDVVYVGLDDLVPPMVPQIDVWWKSVRLRRLTRDRYYRARVYRLPERTPTCPEPGSPWKGPGTPIASIQEGALPARVRVVAANEVRVRWSGGAGVLLGPGESGCMLAFPGASGAVVACAGEECAGAAPAVTFEPVGPLPNALFSRLVVPQVASARGKGGAAWRTDVSLWNTSDRRAAVTVTFLPAEGEGVEGTRRVVLAPGEGLHREDVLNSDGLPWRGTLGTLLIRGEFTDCPVGCGLMAFARTGNLRAMAGADPSGEGLPAIPFDLGMRPGEEVRLSGVTSSSATRANIGLTLVGDGPARTEVKAIDRKGRVVWHDVRTVPGNGVSIGKLGAPLANGVVVVRYVSGGQGRLFVVASVVDNALGTPVHLLPDEVNEAILRGIGCGDGPP